MMMRPCTITLLAFATSALGFGFFIPQGHEFRAPGPYDSRSPCPGLNALANHGYLPRDGKNLDYEMINKASQEAFNFEPGFYFEAVKMVFDFNISTTNRPNETFHLRDLAHHDTIEADGSLTRNDIFFGDDLHFDATVWDPVAKDLGLNHYNFFDRFVTIETAAKATKNRYALAKAVNPQFNASAIQQRFEYGTTALYMFTLWDDEHGAVPKPWVQALLAEDRIPYREGFRKSETVKLGQQLIDMNVKVRAAVGLDS